VTEKNKKKRKREKKCKNKKVKKNKKIKKIKKKRNALWITVVIHNIFGWVNSKFPTPFSLLLN
jgi:hypothetical protein